MLWIWWIRKNKEPIVTQSVCAWLDVRLNASRLLVFIHISIVCALNECVDCIELGIGKKKIYHHPISGVNVRQTRPDTIECDAQPWHHLRRLNSPFLNRSNFSRRSSSSSRLYLDRNGQNPKKKILLGISSNHHHSQFFSIGTKSNFTHFTHTHTRICCVDEMRVCEQRNCLLCSDEIKIFIFNKKNMFWLHNTHARAFGGMLGSCCDQRDAVIQGVKSQYWINGIILCWAFYCCVKTN